MSQQVHTEDLARTDVSGEPAGDQVLVADLADDPGEGGTSAPTTTAEREARPMGPAGSTGTTPNPTGTTPAPTGTTSGPTGTTPAPTGSTGSTGTAGHWAGITNADDLRQRWEAIQTGFVDEPRRAVEQADALVAQVIQELARSFADERQRLEAQWSRGDQVGTEDLRVALQRYRSFFQDLLSH
jgi:hypothetical protein